MKLDFTYIINLNTPIGEVKNKMNKVKWPYNIPYYNLSAINGWEAVKDPTKSPFKFKLARWWKSTEYGEKAFYNRDVTPGEAGCMLSHYQCIHNAYRDGFENILIFEEDFVPTGKFPSQAILDEVPSDCSLLYLDRNALWDYSRETKISKNVTKVGYTYNNHAYIVTRKGMKEVIDSAILDNVIVSDEFFPAINGTSDRKDAVEKFHNPNFKAYALNGGYFSQTSNPSINSLTEFSPEEVNSSTKGQTGKVNLPNQSKTSLSILDYYDDIDKWEKKYINGLILNQQYDLIIDEPSFHVYTFPFFTKEFCSELIELSETIPWTTDRHKFYPTTDNLLADLGMGEIYNELINKHVQPLAKHVFQLEGKSWDTLRDESFIIRYKSDEQSHLSLHHDHSNITTLVNLNPGEFKGGGTFFNKTKVVVNPKEIGVMTLHPGNITHKHGARPVTEGTRYVVVSFITNTDHR
jgi:GR25 family glycosyltransferase involved in LPS biosynthesis